LRGTVALRVVSSDVEVLGRDLLIFLAATTVAVPISQRSGITPILGFIIAGMVIGPAGLSLVGNTEVDVELGDFGILFLLFNEGLKLSVDRFNALVKFAVTIGFAQVVASTVAIALALTAVGDSLGIQSQGASSLFIISTAGALSSSAFALPVLRDNGWEEKRLGLATSGILQLQDLLVPALLAVVPIVQAGGGLENVALVLLKSSLGFGAVVVAGSFLLKKTFELIAETRSMDTFVATALLVAVGMGSLARACGLSQATGAFAAGVLLAGTDYRAQIQADIRPFQGILLGIFFMTAGAGLDPGVVIQNWPAVFSMVAALIAIKAAVLSLILLSSSSLNVRDTARMSLLLAGGGELAFVLFSLAKDLQVLPGQLVDLLNSVVVLSMSVTPILGKAGDALGSWLEDGKAGSSGEQEKDQEEEEEEGLDAKLERLGSDGIIVCGFGEVGQGVFKLLATADQRAYLSFDLNPARVSEAAVQGLPVVYGDGASPKLLESLGVVPPKAIIIAYNNLARRLQATEQLRSAFPGVPIVARARSEQEREELLEAGADLAVAESSEAALQLAQATITKVGAEAIDETVAREALGGPIQTALPTAMAGEDVDSEPEDLDLLALDNGMSRTEVSRLFQVFRSIDKDGNGEVDAEEVWEIIARGSPVPMSDKDFKKYMATLDLDGSGEVTFEEFLSVYRSRDSV